MQQAYDFRDECDAIHQLLEPLTDKDFERVTLFKDWTINNVMAHLHYFNYTADLSLQSDEAFLNSGEEMMAARAGGGSALAVTDQLVGNGECPR